MVILGQPFLLQITVNHKLFVAETWLSVDKKIRQMGCALGGSSGGFRQMGFYHLVIERDHWIGHVYSKMILPDTSFEIFSH